MQEERQKSINAYTDSLRNHNKELNRKLRHLITTMNNQTERVLEAKECHLRESYNRSICVISWLIISAIILLVISYLIIQKIYGKGKNKEAFGRYDTTKHCAVGNAQEYYPDHIA